LEVPAENVEIHDVVVGSRVVEVTHLPWRLANAPKRGDIDVSVELPLLAFRSSSNQAWLPFEYLTDDILESGKLSLKYSYEGPDEVGREGEVLVDMEGFGDVLSWCSKQLLADRLDEPRARAMLSN
jgi:hypothetical protein